MHYRRALTCILSFLVFSTGLAADALHNAQVPSFQISLRSAVRDGAPRAVIGSALFLWAVMTEARVAAPTIRLSPGRAAPLDIRLSSLGTSVAVGTVLTSAFGTASFAPVSWVDGVSKTIALIGTAYAVRTYSKSIFYRPRPWSAAGVKQGGTEKGEHDDTGDSFPSGHALMSWACVGHAAVGALRSTSDLKLLIVLGVQATAVSFLRVAAGEHYAGDVVAGSLIGFGTGVVVAMLALGRPPF